MLRLFRWMFGGESRDGASPAQAVIVNSVGEEYAWLQRHCPGFRMQMQALTEIDGRPFDVLTICNDAGEVRKVYFDISRFYGRM